MDPIQALRLRLAELDAASQQILSAADAENRDLTDDENSQIDGNTAEFDRLSNEIARRERVNGQRQYVSGSDGRRSDPQLPAVVPGQGVRDRSRGNGGDEQQNGNGGRRVFPSVRNPADQARAGFATMGDFLLSVRSAASPGAMPDRRLSGRQDLTNTFANETSGSEGGFLVPPDFRTTLVSRVMGEESLLARCDQIQTTSNSVTMPVDVDEVWNDNTGIYARWENEGGQKPESKLALDQMTIRLNKLVALVPVSDELLEDAPAIEGYVRRKAPDKINYKVSQAIISGSGNGQPLGMLTAPALITVAPGATPADTIQFANLAQMWGRMYGPFRNSAVWLINPELEAQLMLMFFSTAPVASVPATPIPVYLPANSAAGTPYATLFGRPVIPTQACSPAGDVGDIIFADLAQYLALMKTGIIKTDVSIHVYFVQDLTAFRFVLRIGGMPWIPKPYQPRVGTFTQGPFITLGAR
jgi:HK97 family phage major capsid protein